MVQYIGDLNYRVDTGIILELVEVLIRDFWHEKSPDQVH